VWQHLLQRVSERQISLADLSRLQDWVKSEPQAPDGDWISENYGATRRGRTGDLLITNQPLYQLS
jgi:hypothetical protein